MYAHIYLSNEFWANFMSPCLYFSLCRLIFLQSEKCKVNCVLCLTSLNLANQAYFAAFSEKLDKFCCCQHAFTTHWWIRFSSHFDCEKSCHSERQRQLIFKVFVIKIFTPLKSAGCKVRKSIFILNFWLTIISFEIII